MIVRNILPNIDLSSILPRITPSIPSICDAIRQIARGIIGRIGPLAHLHVYPRSNNITGGNKVESNRVAELRRRETKRYSYLCHLQSTDSRQQCDWARNRASGEVPSRSEFSSLLQYLQVLKRKSGTKNKKEKKNKKKRR